MSAEQEISTSPWTECGDSLQMIYWRSYMETENCVNFWFMWNSEHFYLKTNIDETMLQKRSPYK